MDELRQPMAVLYVMVRNPFINDRQRLLTALHTPMCIAL